MSSDQVVAGDATREPTDGFPLDEPAVQRALESVAELERALGPDHPDTLNARNSLAAAYQAAGRVADAIPLFEHVLVARQRVLGPRDADTLTSQNNLAVTYQEAGRHAEAILLFKLTLAAREQLLGADHPDVRAARDDLAAAEQESVGAVPGPVEPPVAPSSDDAALEPILEPPVAPAEAKLPAAAAIVELPAMVPAAETDDQPPPAEEPAQEPPAEQPSAAPSNQRPGPARHRPTRRRRRVLSLVAAIVIVLAGGAVAGLLTRPHAGHYGPAGSHGTGSQPLSAAGQLAAVWVAQRVAGNAIVACDPLMCSALEAQGVPAANLLVLRADTTSPLGAEMVVVTPAIRSEFGSRVSSVYAPSVIAGFGSGAGKVSVQVVARDGPAAYLTALRQDAADRKTAGAQLLANKHILASAQARAQLAAGAVDSRLLLMLPALAAVYPIQVLAFDPAPGAGPGVPLCSADLSGSGQVAKVSDTNYLRWLTSFVGTQLVPFAGTMSVLTEGGQPVVRVVFAEPSLLGLLAHT